MMATESKNQGIADQAGIRAAIGDVVAGRKIGTAAEKQAREREMLIRTQQIREAQMMENPVKFKHLSRFHVRIERLERMVHLQGIQIEALSALLTRKGIPLPLRFRRSVIRKADLNREADAISTASLKSAIEEMKHAAGKSAKKPAPGNNQGAPGAQAAAKA